MDAAAFVIALNLCVVGFIEVNLLDTGVLQMSLKMKGIMNVAKRNWQSKMV